MKEKAKFVELKFFGGLNVEETAEVLGISSDTVIRDRRLAKIWLLRGAQPVNGS
ncbi:MAG: ECF-type sigma factor [Candidatus Sulfotelmatobacter sp.]|jgi:DNA-directed RNA polymerase specialized sigma24 family protein